jgi:formate hydrogenlyase transcriptional activator
VRAVAATKQDLAGLVAEKLFRMDLYYRLNVFRIAVPPLRHRHEDIPMLVAYFVNRYATGMAKRIDTITSDAMEALLCYPWPGNIRELQNFIDRSVILTNGDVLHLSALPSRTAIATGPVTLAEAERGHILNALRESHWVVGGAAGDMPECLASGAAAGVPRHSGSLGRAPHPCIAVSCHQGSGEPR